MPVRIVAIVEGHGEVHAVPIMLRRICAALAPEVALDVPRPLRVMRTALLRDGEFERYVELAARRLGDSPGGVIVILDADDDCAALLAADLRRRVAGQRSTLRASVVLPVREFESWFIAAGASLRSKRGLQAELDVPEQPESIRDAKGWLQRQRADGRAYSPTVDQPALAALFDLDMARQNSPSFDKLWRELDELISNS